MLVTVVTQLSDSVQLEERTHDSRQSGAYDIEFKHVNTNMLTT